MIDTAIVDKMSVNIQIGAGFSDTSTIEYIIAKV
jgi:hypothetical protein